MPDPIPTTPASSAAPATAPATPAVSATPAATAATQAPATLNDFAELARQSIAGETPATPVIEPPATGQEPSPAAAAPDPAEPAPVESPVASDADASADDMANWSEGEKKLHGALVKERSESKEARAKLREAEAELARLKSTNPPAEPVEPEPPAVQTTNPPSVSVNLADCTTFEAVDARVVQAAAVEAQAVNLQNMLLRSGVEPVAQRLKASGVENINGVPVTEASADEIGEFLAATYEGAHMTVANGPLRKNWLTTYYQSLQEAVRLIPELNDQNSAAFQAARQMIADDPAVRSKANWPEILAERYLGKKNFAAAKTTPAPTAPPKPAAAKPAPKPAPGAPRTSTAAIPQPSANAALAAKIANGTATLAEVQQYTREHVVAV